ncbi:MAG: SRPBCC family protein [Actinobacteria bacterium]|nr:SRPBCC family protein [Actinomycetota bacterium]
MKPSTDTRRSFVGAPLREVEARRAATRLRNLLRSNALFSTFTGLVAAVAAGPVAELLGVDQVWVVRVLGGALVAFAGVVLVVSGVRTSLLLPASLIVSIGDLVWVAGTLAAFALGWLSTSGVVAMGATGVIVLGLGLAQLRARAAAVGAIAASDCDFDEVPPVEVVTFDRPASVTPEQLWPVMIDHELYAKLALNLTAAKGLTPDGLGFQRSCTDTAGRSWSETCTLWEPGRRFDVDVDTSDYPYPLARMQGSWRVEPAGPEGSTVGMTFAFQPTPGLRGRFFVALMHLAFPPILKRIVRGWIRAAATTAPAAR